MLSDQQHYEFKQFGIVRLSSAVAQPAVEEMLRVVWSCLREHFHVHRDARETWPELDDRGVNQVRFTGSRHLPNLEKFAQVGSLDVCAALDRIFGTNNWQRPDRWRSLLVTFPESRDRWDLPASAWHLDLPAKHLLSEIPAVRLFTCLATISHGGGATLAVASSHRLVQSLVRPDERISSAQMRKRLLRAYPWFKELCSREEQRDRIQRFMKKAAVVAGTEVRVVEMTGQAGDVFLMHPMILHAPSKNCLSNPRLALSATVFRTGVTPVKLYR